MKIKCECGHEFEISEKDILSHKVLCGDATKEADILKLMDGKKADFILCDPPYGMNLDTDFSDAIGRKNHTRGNKYNPIEGDNIDFNPMPFIENFDYVKEQFWFGADYYAERLKDKNKGSWLVWDNRKESQAEAIGSEFELIWSRQKHKRRILRHDWFGFLSSQNTKDAQNRLHPAQKPVSLLADILMQWGKDNDKVIDFFLGSGTTLIAAEQLNRICYGCEISKAYCDVILDRFVKLTGDDPIREDGVKWSELKSSKIV